MAGSPSLIGQTPSQNGFLGSYFNSLDFSQRVLVRVDSEVDFNWQTQSPGQGVNRDGFSVTWQGALTPEFSEEYTFLINSDGLVNLWIDDVLLVDGSRSPTSRTHSGKILLSSGQSYQLKLDYVHASGAAFARLFWTSSSRSLEIIPKERVTLQSEDINFPPMVQVPPVQNVSPPSMDLLLAGNVVDDDFSGRGQIGRDYGSVAWSQSSGPGEVQFEDASNLVTRATFPLMGEYVLNLEAVDDAGQSSNADMVVMVDNPPWPMHHIDNFSWNHNSLSPGDVNGDGFDDYAVMHEGPDTYTVVFHPGSEGNDKALWPITQIGRGGNPEYSYIADFDGDGNMDVVGGGGADGSQPPGVKVFWGPAPGSSMDGSAWTDSGVFPQTANKGHILFIEAHDINSDGLVDIVVGGRLQNNPRVWAGLYWLEAPQDPEVRRNPSAWEFHYIDDALMSGHGFVFTDIDQDGDNDFVVANADWNTPESEERVLWYENPGNGTPAQFGPWPRHVIYRGDEFFAKPQVGVGDLNGDGLIDLCVQVEREIFYFRKTGLNPVTWDRMVIPKPAYTQWLNRPTKIADLNGDGQLDIVGMLIHNFGDFPEGMASVFWMEYTGDDPTADNWVTHVIKWSNGSQTGQNFRGEKWDHLRFLDMDRDGDLDIIGNCEEHYDSGRRTLVGAVWFENRLNEAAYTYTEDSNGLTVIEAENYSAMSDGDWFIHTEHEGYTGEGYLVEFHTEDQPAQDWNQSGGVGYEVILEGGEYEIWVRRGVPSNWGRRGGEKSNSVWLGINGQVMGESFFDDSPEGFDGWTWVNQLEDGSPLTVSLPEGRHHLNLQGREGGYAIDQIVIAQVGAIFNRDDTYDWGGQYAVVKVGALVAPDNVFVNNTEVPLFIELRSIPIPADGKTYVRDVNIFVGQSGLPMNADGTPVDPADTMEGLTTTTNDGVNNNSITGIDSWNINNGAGRNATSPEWETRMFGGMDTFTSTNGDGVDFIMIEQGGNDDLWVKPVFPDGTTGQYVKLADGDGPEWGNTGLETLAGAPGNGQKIVGLGWKVEDLLDADGNNLAPDTEILGLRFNDPAQGDDPALDPLLVVAVIIGEDTTPRAVGEMAGSNTITLAADPTADITVGKLVQLEDGTTLGKIASIAGRVLTLEAPLPVPIPGQAPLTFVDAPDAATGKFINISTRAMVGTGDDVMIGGFIIGEGLQQVLVEAIGPELADRGVAGALADPVLTITAADGTVLMINDNWEDSQGQLVRHLWGGSPNVAAGSASSAAVLTLEPGNYTAKVQGKDGTTGVALVEVYQMDN